MTEFEKMRGKVPYNFEDKDVLKHVVKANKICAKLSNLTVDSPEYRSLIEELVPSARYKFASHIRSLVAIVCTSQM